jgi:hypothetical protein
VAHREPVAIPWPEEADLRALLKDRAEALLIKEGILTPGFERVLARHALGFLKAARSSGWPGPGAESAVLGVEVNGVVTLTDHRGADREIRFRADRVDRAGDGLRLVDYKAGRPFAEQKKQSSRDAVFHKKMARGELLQAAAYALGGEQCTQMGAVGSYLNLAPDTADEARSSEVDSEDAELTRVFTNSVNAVLAAFDFGSFFPRLIEPSSDAEPYACQSCQVKEACLRGDSGARRILERWAKGAAKAGAKEHSPAERAALRLWELGVSET